MITFFRNKFFDWGILPSKKFDFPVISVGNLSVGGSGKSPHIEYLVRLLQNKYKVSTLSRGHGRSTKGFLQANSEVSFNEIGDEPLQYKNKFPKIEVAVDTCRVRGIKILKTKNPDLQCFLLDDAYQHRYIKPGMNILLTDFHNLYVNDYPIPCGNLREFRSGVGRADIIVVTKTPFVFSPLTRRRLTRLIHPKKNQSLFFSTIKYGKITPVPGLEINTNKRMFNTILLFSGIANSYPLQEHLRDLCSELIIIDFKDHHKYNHKDILKIKKAYHDIFSKNKVIITTEKDAMRIIKTDLFNEIKELPVFYIPIEIKFHNGDNEKFDKQILDYVRKNTRNSKIHKQ